MRLARASLLALLLVHPASAYWPFQERNFNAEAFVDAGSLGVNSTGRVVAVGDWDGDQKYVLRRWEWAQAD